MYILDGCIGAVRIKVVIFPDRDIWYMYMHPYLVCSLYFLGFSQNYLIYIKIKVNFYLMKTFCV